ncbi:MAG: neutral/alkaline non-lysosomal ceramidase N-terminal domain-containing protein [Bacteroidales bacterium]|nr:neutral/alkaline non-lysosomal ceramidase N-terminal domain-containing protein [Bacteroidales bacterium]
MPESKCNSPYGTIINGDFLPNYANEIHDSLYAKALAFDNGVQKFVFIVVDNMTLDALLDNEAKAIITRETGLTAGQVMISNTHSHSTGAVIETATVQADMSYRIYMPGRIAKAAAQALKNLQPAKIAWGHIDVPKHVSCRRWYMKPGFPMINPFGDEEKVWMNPPLGSEFLDRPVSQTDPQVSFLAVKTLDDKWIGILANYSTHYVGGVPANVISADYYGEVDVMLKSKLKAGNDFVGIMSNGTSGDVNTMDFKLTKNYPSGDYEKIKMIANEITDSIVKVLRGVRYIDRPEFRVSNGESVIVRRQPSAKQLAWANERVRTTEYTKLGTADKASDDIKSLYALDIVKLDFYEPSSYKLKVQAIRIGDGVIGTLPGEIFSETGLKLKKNSPFEYYFTISHANGQFGYVPPAEQFQLGGYETWLCSGSLLETSAESKLSAALIALVKSLH